MIDTHQHLLYRNDFEYPWTAEFPPLLENFRLEEYRLATRGTPIQQTIFMEVDVAPGTNVREAGFFCSLAEDPSTGIVGVIASAKAEQDDFAGVLDAMSHPRLVGIRRILHTQPDPLSQTSLFRQNVRLLGARNLNFDICALQRQLGIAADLIRSCPDTTFVLDHCGVPDIANNDAPHGEGWQLWKSAIHEIAHLPNVNCKISGISVYAAAHQLNEDGLRPYIAEVIAAFGPQRCVWGGDWPVVNLASDLATWCALSRSIISSEAGGDADAIFSDNARRIYRLKSPAPTAG